MVGNIFKNIGRGIGYFFAFPGLLIAITIYAVFGLIVFIYQFFKLIVLFFTGRTLFSDLPEDIKLKALLDTNPEEGGSEQPVEPEKQPEPEEVSTQTAPVYGGGYTSLYMEANPEPEQREEPQPEIEPEPEHIAPKIEPEPEEGGNNGND